MSRVWEGCDYSYHTLRENILAMGCCEDQLASEG